MIYFELEGKLILWGLRYTFLGVYLIFFVICR